MDSKSGFTLKIKPIVNEVWGYRISQVRLRQLRSQLLSKYRSLFKHVDQNKEVIEDLILQIDIDHRKYFEVYYFDSNFMENFSSPVTSFEA